MTVPFKEIGSEESFQILIPSSPPQMAADRRLYSHVFIDRLTETTLINDE